MAAEVNKPDFSYVWASGGAIVAPSDVKTQTGWTAEVPPFQWENYLQNRQDNAILHLFQKGISEWDAASNYYFTTSGVRSYVQGSDGVIYVAVADSVGQNPTTDATDTYWKIAFIDQTALNTTLSGGRTQSFTTTGSFVVPLTVTEIIVSGCAAGGGGGAGGGPVAGTNLGAGGGAGGAGQSLQSVRYTVTPGSTISWTLGSAGTKGLGVSGATGGSGAAAGNTVISGIPSGTITLIGGSGGAGGISAVSPVGGAIGGSGYPRGGSGSDASSNGSPGDGAFGGSSPFGGGGSNGRGGASGAPSAVNNGSDAGGYGAGGGSGGGYYTGAATQKGGDGGDGSPAFLKFEW